MNFVYLKRLKNSLAPTAGGESLDFVDLKRLKNSLDPTAGGEPLKPRHHERVHLLTGAHPKSRHLMMIVLIVVMMNVVLILEDGDSIGAHPKSCHLMIVLIIVMMKKQVILVNSPDRPRSKCCPLFQFGDVDGISDGDGRW